MFSSGLVRISGYPDETTRVATGTAMIVVGLASGVAELSGHGGRRTALAARAWAAAGIDGVAVQRGIARWELPRSSLWG